MHLLHLESVPIFVFKVKKLDFVHPCKLAQKIIDLELFGLTVGYKLSQHSWSPQWADETIHRNTLTRIYLV